MTPAADEPVGIIGLGLLGAAIARRLRWAEYVVLGYDVEPDRRRELSSAGGRAVGSPAELAARCERILLSLPTSGDVATVVDELLPHLAPDALLIDTTTGAPTEVEAIGARLSAHGIGYVDATVGGSSRQAEAGEVIVTVGGEADHVARSRDVLEAFGRRVVHTGPLGSGSRTKLVVNLVLGLHRAVLAEGLVFAERLGLDAEATLAILEAGPAASAVMATKGRKILHRDYAPVARLAQHLKDVRLILDAASTSDTRLPLSELHARLLEQAVAAGFGDADNGAVIEAIARAK